MPVNEWVMTQFLQSLDHLVKRGLRFDYQRIEEEQRYLRGQLDVAKQIRLPPGRRHYFQLRHDVFLANRPENRLLRLALERVVGGTQDADNWRRSSELQGLLQQVPVSTDIAKDLRQWGNDRLMAHYQTIRPWCEMILTDHMPLAVFGEYRGISLLFPMEKLFERYVEVCLRRSLPADTRLIRQPAREYLCQHDGGSMFRLEPDLLLERGGRRWILDTKWKRVDATARQSKYGLSQADFYQMLAYGHRYFGQTNVGDMVLIYPRRSSFQVSLPEFTYAERLRLWVSPFDLDDGYLHVAGLGELDSLLSR